MRRTTTLLGLLLAMPAVSIATLAAGPAWAKLEKYERKSISVLASEDNVLNRLFTQGFVDLGRFDYDQIPVGKKSSSDPMMFLRQVKAYIKSIAADRAAGRAIPDQKFNDKVVSGEDLEKISKAAYLLVPNFEWGEVSIGDIVRPDEDSEDDHLSYLKLMVDFPLTLTTQVINVDEEKVVKQFSHTQHVFMEVRSHHREGGSDREARAHLERVAQALRNGGPPALAHLVSPQNQLRILRAMSPDQIAKINAEAERKSGKERDAYLAAASLEHDPNKAIVNEYKVYDSLDSRQWEALERAQQAIDQQGEGSPLHQLLSNINMPMGVIPNAINVARGMQEFRITAPIGELAGDSVKFGFGFDTGVDLDTWFRVETTERDDSGNRRTIEKGWVKVSDVAQSVSTADNRLGWMGYEEGDQLVEYPKIGLNSHFLPYLGLNLTPAGGLIGGFTWQMAYDIAPYMNRVSGRKSQMPELFGTLDLGALIPLDGSSPLAGQAELGVVKKFFARNLGVYVGARGGGLFAPNGSSSVTKMWGGSALAGVNLQFSPDWLIDLGANAGFYTGDGSSMMPVSARAGIALSF